MTTEERLAKVEQKLGRARRRSRWLLAALGLGLGALALVWASAASAPSAEAQGAVGETGERQQWPLMLMQKAAHLQAVREKVARVEPESPAEQSRRSPSDLFPGKPSAAPERSAAPEFDGFERLLLDNALAEARLAALAEARNQRNEENTSRLLNRERKLESIQKDRIYHYREYPMRLAPLELSPEDKTLLLDAIDLARAVALAGARAGGNEIRANRFVLEDENGKVRAVLDVVKDVPRLSLFDENGKERAVLGVTALGAGLSLFDENGKGRAALGVGADGPLLSFFDENGKTRAGLDVTALGAGLNLADENGNVRAALGVVKDGPRLGLIDAAGKEVWSAP